MPQGYVEAAESFQKESNTKPGVDLAAITDRMEIRKAVQSGDIQNAIERVNDLNPEVDHPEACCVAYSTTYCTAPTSTDQHECRKFCQSDSHIIFETWCRY